MKVFPMSCCVLPLIGVVTSSCSFPSNLSTAGGSKAARTELSTATLTSASTPKVLSLNTACALAVSHHPSLATYPMDRRAADARILKATRLPNPQLSIDAEDFFGTGGVSGLSSSVINTLLTQVIERGGKRQARTDAALSKSAVMTAEYEMRRLKVIRVTGELYIDAVASHENVRFLESALGRARETLKLVTALNDAGRVTLSAVQQAQLEVQKMELEINTARKARERASQALTAQWGDSRSTLVVHNGLGAPPEILASKASQMGGLVRHPKVLHAQAEVAQAEAYLKLAQANRVSNLSVFGGPRRDNGGDETSSLLGLSIPLRVFDKKKDAIAEMTALSDKAKAELAGSRRELETQFSLAWSDLVSAHQAARKVKKDLLPISGALFKSAEESFRVGEMTSLEFLAAQQQFEDIRGKWLTARREYQIRAVRVQTLTNRSL